MKNQLRTLMHGAFILTVASFIAKLLSALYRVPFQNLVGDEGFYVYQQVYPFYGLAMTLALTGLPQFISKIVAESKTIDQQRTQLRMLYPLVFWLAVVLWASLFFFSRAWAQLMGDPQLQPLIEVVAFTFLLVPPLTFYRGFFQGNLEMMPPAVSQVFEQIVRVSLIIGAAMAYRHFSLTIYQTGYLALAGAVAGGVCAWIYLRVSERKMFGEYAPFQQYIYQQRVPYLFVRRFFVEGGLLTIYSGILILFQLIDAFLIVNVLKWQGVAESQAQLTKGIYDRGQPLVQLGLVAALALSATFLPALTKYLLEKKTTRFIVAAKIYLRLTVTIGAVASCGLMLIMPYLNMALFKDAAGSDVLRVFVWSIVLVALVQAYQNIAQSQNYFRFSFRAACYGLVVKVIANILFTMWWGTIGTSLATLAGLSVMLWKLQQLPYHKLNAFWTERQFYLRLLKCLAAMTIGVSSFYFVLAYIVGPATTRGQALVWSLAGVGVGAVCFFRAMLRFKLLTVREWLLLPFGKKILRKAQKIKK